MSTPYFAQITLFGFNFAPRNWSFCKGDTISISSNSALFSILGTTYGGDGRQNFQLPHLHARVAIHQGRGDGLSTYALGATGGEATHILSTAELPSHSHAFSVEYGPNNDSSNFSDAYLSHSQAYFSPTAEANEFMKGIPNDASDSAGGNVGHENEMPYLALNYCIAMQGQYPARS